MMGPIYVITDPDAPLPVIAQVRAAAQGGASLIQIRDKRASDEEFAALVTQLLPEIAPYNAKLIINDRVDVALATRAHGLHIGQGDGDPRTIRQRLPDGMILGLSIVNEMQAHHIPEGIDYIGAGPIRPTPTKPDHAPPIGFEGLTRIIATAKLPTYAIGGIGPGDAAAIKATGAIGMAVVSAVTRAPDPIAATRTLLREWSAS